MIARPSLPRLRGVFVVAPLLVGGAALGVAQTPQFPPAGDYPFGSLTSPLVQNTCSGPSCGPLGECSATTPNGFNDNNILGSHLRSTGRGAIMSVSTGFFLQIDETNGDENQYQIAGNAVLTLSSSSGGTVFFSSVIPGKAGEPAIGNSFAFTTQTVTDNAGNLTFDFTIDFPFCKLPVQGKFHLLPG